MFNLIGYFSLVCSGEFLLRRRMPFIRHFVTSDPWTAKGNRQSFTRIFPRGFGLSDRFRRLSGRYGYHYGTEPGFGPGGTVG